MLKHILTIIAAIVAIPSTAQDIIINEIMAANVDVYQDPSTNFGCWVELYNPTDQEINLGGLYVSDSQANLKKHKLISTYGKLPAKGFAILNFDHYEQWTKNSYRQIDDKLDADGGTIVISDGTNILAQEKYPAAIGRVSYARTTDGGSQWGLTSAPTPGKTNSTSEFATVQLPAPVVTPEAQFFTGTLKVNVEIPEGCTLRYTNNGSTPTLTNGITATSGTFTISSTQCYRFRLFQDGKLASDVTTRSYIKDSKTKPFPVISIVTNNNNILNGTTAIFSYSSNGRPGNGQTSAYNANMDWDRPVNFEYFDAEGKCVLSQECDFSACGGWSRGWSPHSFKLKANKIYGINYMPYQFFNTVEENPSTANGKQFLKHKTLQIRNGGNDTGCRLKDAAIQEIVTSSGLYVEHQSWQPVMVYINGTYYNVLNMREPNNKHYGYANYGIDTDMMDQFEVCADSGYVQKEGTKEAFNRWYTLSKTASSTESYEEICKLVDIDEYCNYMAVCLYAGSDDWPQNNFKGFRDQEDGKFRFVLFDLDFTLNLSNPISTFLNKRNYTFNELYGYDYSKNKSINNTRLTKEIELVTIFQNMLNNATFRKKFIDTYCLVAGSIFEPKRVSEIVSKMASYLGKGGYVSPTNSANDLKNGFTSSRQSSIINELKNSSYMKLSSITPQQVTLSSNIDGAQILVNDIEVPTGKFSGKLFSPITLTAKAPAGYKFAGWLTSSTTGGKPIFSNGSTWKYYDNGSLDNTGWKNTNYSDTSWKSGATPIGYGKNQATTTTKNLMTYYMRKSINISDYNSSDIFVLNFTIDDGMVIYVNGKEAGRYNMPNGTVYSSTAATTYAPGNPDTGSMTLDASLFQNGTNVIAVEIHNNQTSSSDILWNCELLRTTAGSVSYASHETTYEMPTTGNLNITASWEKIADDALVASCAAPIKINEVSAGNEMYINELMKKDDWIELYNTTDTDIDAAGLYLSDNLAKPQKYQISSNVSSTIIPAKGHLIIWCSKREAQSMLHAPFKLDNADGLAVTLSSSDEFFQNNATFFSTHPELKKEFSDTLSYSAMHYDQTIGRYPDGGKEYYLFNHPTISYANSLQNSDKFIGTDTSTPPSSDAIININTDDDPSTHHRYYTPSGIFMGTDRSRLPQGIYKRGK